MATSLGSAARLLAAACALAGSPPSSLTTTCTGCPLMPPSWLLTYFAQAGTTVAPWLLLDACGPVSDAMTPTVIGVPVSFAAEPESVLEVELAELPQALRATSAASGSADIPA